MDDCWRRACSVTNEWVYDATAPAPLKGRIKQRFCSEYSVPLKNRDLAEVLSPQPDASIVINRLLNWIDRVDNASQAGSAKPAFETEGGQPIFPEGDEPWWLTDVARRAPEEEQEGDEDGPASEVEGEQAADESDDDPLSDPEACAHNTGPHEPNIMWRT